MQPNAGIDARKGRWVLMLLVLTSATVTFLTLFIIGYGGAIHPDSIRSSIKQLMEIYLPLLGLMVGFYFAKRGSSPRRKQKVSLEALIFSIAITGLWVLSPIFILIFINTIEESMRTLKVINPFGQTTAIAAVAFYFSKSS